MDSLDMFLERISKLQGSSNENGETAGSAPTDNSGRRRGGRNYPHETRSLKPKDDSNLER